MRDRAFETIESDTFDTEYGFMVAMKNSVCNLLFKYKNWKLSFHCLGWLHVYVGMSLAFLFA